ncbi:hypothetical protein [Bacillus sp. FJAT-22090]|uniref:hypothetical protein n=1 Tax=Bacillus sp. FJAT-22090 TaxID=1581038 RepID=UPI0011A3EDA3|nr:hypothetical protein [Bacillus sp. FJAT-22090]
MLKALTISELERALFRKKTLVLFIAYLIIIIGSSAFLSFFDMGFYNRETQAPLNNLNLPVLVAKEVYIILSLLIFPLLFIDSFSGEVSSGSYRMVMIKPGKRIEFVISKIISQLIIVLLFLISGFVVSFIYGSFSAEQVKSVSILNHENLNQIGALLYTAKYYGVLFVIFMSIMIIAHVVCSIFSNTVLNFIIILALIVGSLYISDNFSFFLIAGEYTFNLINNGNITFFVINGIIITIGFFITILIWSKKDVYD